MLRMLHLVAIEREESYSLHVGKWPAVLFISAEVVVLGLDFRILSG